MSGVLRFCQTTVPFRGGFEEDRQVLEAKIEEAYVSKAHFEVLVQAVVSPNSDEHWATF